MSADVCEVCIFFSSSFGVGVLTSFIFSRNVVVRAFPLFEKICFVVALSLNLPVVCVHLCTHVFRSNVVDWRVLLNFLSLSTPLFLSHMCCSSQANASVLSKYSLDGDACVKNMRILSLCSLASQHGELPYALIARDLEVEESEVTYLE